MKLRLSSAPATGRPIRPKLSKRNLWLDPWMYAVDRLSREEYDRIVAGCEHGEYHEGGIFLADKAENTITYHAGAAQLPDDCVVQAIAVPGVGSSPLGAAAFARQVADATDLTTAGVIAGYGTYDLMSEAVGGWWVFGARNMSQAALDTWVRLVAPGLARENGEFAASLPVDDTLVDPEEHDVITALRLMLRGRTGALRLVVGHSKGALVLQNAARRFGQKCDFTGPRPWAITFACAVDFPHGLFREAQFIGTADWLARVNTPPFLYPDPRLQFVPGRSHSVARGFPPHLPLEEKLRKCGYVCAECRSREDCIYVLEGQPD